MTELIINAIGLAGAACFALCSLPQISKCIREGHATGVSTGFILMGIGGNILSGIYLLYRDVTEGITHWPIYANYSVALILCLVLLALKVRDRLRGLPSHIVLQRVSLGEMLEKMEDRENRG